MDNQVLQALRERRSIKKYKPEQVPEEQLKAILEAGMYAANGRGMQAAVMAVVQDKETIAQLTRMNAEIMGLPAGADPFYGAPTIVVVLADRTRNTYIEDGSLVIGNLMTAAYSLGVDSCWIHRAREEFESVEGKALLDKWGIKGDYAGIGHCILGYRDCEYPQAKPRKENFVYRV